MLATPCKLRCAAVATVPTRAANCEALAKNAEPAPTTPAAAVAMPRMLFDLIAWTAEIAAWTPRITSAAVPPDTTIAAAASAQGVGRDLLPRSQYLRKEAGFLAGGAEDLAFLADLELQVVLADLDVGRARPAVEGGRHLLELLLDLRVREVLERVARHLRQGP